MKITGTVFPVRDVAVSLRYFTEVLGFKKEFQFGEYAGVELTGCLIHLSKQGNPNTAEPGNAGVYVFCDAVDEYYKEIVRRGAKVGEEPRDYPYGMRDFVAEDPDGNKISFGCAVKKG